ncbi:MAG: acetate kinase [Clostridiales bacterium]|jgi:acetate kinase|nr:acetate kinase [Clostridiales bacterium]
MKVLVLNCGSSSLKYQLIDMENETALAKGLCERIGIDGRLKHSPLGKDEYTSDAPMKDHTDAVRLVLDALLDANHGVIKSIDEVNAVGHRVVHGGEHFSASVLITPSVKKAIEECCALAPLHNPPNLIGVNACEKLMPGVPQAAVFDTAFHQTMPPKAYLYSIPYEMYEKYKIRRYGFHGTSHKYVAQRAASLLQKPIEQIKMITCHLGNGASICAVEYGKSVDTSMGFTPLEGLTMGTRSGSLDPAIISFWMEKEHIQAKDVENILNKKSGVLGLSGVSSDFRDIETAKKAGNERAAIALDVFYYKVAKTVGEYAAAMNGADAVVFTAGLGENSAVSRVAICAYLGYLGVSVDPEKNGRRGEEIDISTASAAVRALVIPTNEELMIARDTKQLLES